MRRYNFSVWAAALIGVLVFACGVRAEPLWDLAVRNKGVLKIATLFTAQDVRDRLSTDQGIDDAIDWCKQTGVTHAFVESFRGGYTAERKTLEHARDRFRAAGLEVSGCVTTTKVGKDSTGWKEIACYTDEPTQKHLQEIFEYTAALFDEIMIDDFWFTDCECPECQQARGGKTWADFRCDLMVQVSRDRILKPARAVNPNVKVIIKYPQWYDQFHQRGYEVVRQTADFDRIWVGTETRDYADPRWGGKVQYEAYYIMRWLGTIGGPKCGGGWFDPYGTHEDTYVEQARQTVLAGAKEMLLFCYGSLLKETGPANVARLRTEIPDLFTLAKLAQSQPPKGIAAPKPPNSDGGDEQYVYDFVGMLGLPLVPTDEIRTDDKAVFLPVHALKDPQLCDKLTALLDADKPVLMTDGLARKLPPTITGNKNVLVLPISGKPNGLLALTCEQLQPIRDKLLAPFGLRFDAPNKVALHLLGTGAVVIQNFNDEPVAVSLASKSYPFDGARCDLVLPRDRQVRFQRTGGKIDIPALPPRTLVVLRCGNI